MTDIQENVGIKIIFATDGNGQFVAASTSSPYFCFQDTSEAKVKASVDAAIATYVDYKLKPTAVSPPRTISITTLSPDRIEERKLAHA